MSYAKAGHAIWPIWAEHLQLGNRGKYFADDPRKTHFKFEGGWKYKTILKYLLVIQT